MTHVELRDGAIGILDQHPNIEMRLFNGWQQRGLFGRIVEGATRFTQLNRRMHNKQMIADNRAAIIGGRNIGDEYFGLNENFNFHDLDVLAVGPAAREASAVFDRYWNSDTVRRPPAVPAPGCARSAICRPIPGQRRSWPESGRGRARSTHCRRGWFPDAAGSMPTRHRVTSRSETGCRVPFTSCCRVRGAKC
jgi:phosphatidylserine/phosphatidylglycerophosphate/cardiolipin synthase-like enzyme